jgi:hypothetical protein
MTDLDALTAACLGGPDDEVRRGKAMRPALGGRRRRSASGG